MATPKHNLNPLYDSKLILKIFEFIHEKSLKEIQNELCEEDIKIYLYQLLLALYHCHSHGIIHRDVKPRNIVVNPEKKKLKLIDFGLSEYYVPDREMPVRVASRPYKGPELLVSYRTYDYSLDLWSFGCILAQMVTILISSLGFSNGLSIYGKKQRGPARKNS